MRAAAHPVSGWRTAWSRTHSPNSGGGGGKTLILALLLAAALAWGLTAQPLGARGAALPKPTGLTVSDATQIQFTLTWNAVAGAADYEVKRGEGGEPTTVAGTSYRFWGPNAGTTYTLYVRARDAQGATSVWAMENASTLAPGLASPANVTAVAAGPTEITLSWDAVPGAVFYSVWSSGAPGANTTKTSYTVSDLSANASHYVSVRARAGQDDNPDVSFWVTRTVATPARTTPAPAAPGGLTVSNATQVQFTLSWNAVTGATDYQVKRGAAGDVTTVTSTSHRFWGSNAGTAYTLYVRARSAQGAVSTWATKSASTRAPGLAAPTNVTAVAAGPTEITLSWDAVPGAVSYSVWSSGAPGGSTTGTSYTVSGLSANASHFVSVRARAGQDDNPNVSLWVERTVATPAVPPPTVHSPSANSTTITFSWSAVAGATGYEVKRSPGSETPTAVTGTSHSFGRLIAGLEYTLYVRAKIGNESSLWRSTTASIPTPDGLSVIAATPDSITVAWSAVTGADSYEVKAGADGAITAVTSGRSYEFTGLLPSMDESANILLPYHLGLFGNDRTLYVRGKNTTTTQPFPWRLITARTVGRPHGSQSFITTNSTSITMCVLCYNSAGSQAVRFKLGPSGAVATVRPTRGRLSPDIPLPPNPPAQAFTHTFTGLAPATTYTIAEDDGVYTLHASPVGPVPATTVAKQWNSGWGTFTTAPAAPRGLRATPNSAGLTLSWSPVTGATRYDVKLGADGPATTVPAAATSYTFTGLAPSTEYRLYVHARNGGGSSEWKSRTETTLSTLTPPPSGLTVTDATPPTSLGLPRITPASLTLSWDAVSGATSYEVKRSPGSETPTAVTGTSYTFPNLTADTEYTLYVRGKAGAVTFPWRSITAKTEAAKWESGVGSSLHPIHVVPTSTSLTVFTAFPTFSSVSSAGAIEVKLDKSVSPTTSVCCEGGSFRHFNNSSTFAGLTADTEYTIYVRSRRSSDSAWSAWRSIAVKTLPAQFSGTRTTSFGQPGVAFHGSGTIRIGSETIRIGGGVWPLLWAWSSSVTSTDRYFEAVRVGEEAAEFTYYLRSTVSGSADPPVYQWTPYTATTAPWHPTRLSATATSDSLTLRWAVVPGATGYRVKRGESGAVEPAAGTSHTFDNLTAGTPYTLYVYAENQGENRGGNSEWSSITASTTIGPAVPSDLIPSATSTSITLSWNAVTGATGYDVKLGTTETPVTGTSYEFTGLTAGTPYWLYVRAKNSAGVVSEWMPRSVTTIPAAPSDLVVDPTTATSTSLTLSWPAVTGATGYDVKRGTTEFTVPSGATNYTFNNLTANAPYTLSVRARNESGASPWAPSLSRTTAPRAPGGVGLNRLDDNSGFQLVWNAAAGATGYEVKIGPDGAKTTAADATNRRHNFTGLGEGVWYTFYVRAVNSWGAASEWSKSINTRWVPPSRLFVLTAVPPPGGLEASVSGADLKLTWTAARLSAVTTYEVKLNAGGTWTQANWLDCPALKGCHTFSGLTAGTYALYVRAKSNSGPPLNRVTTSPERQVTKTIAPAAPTP